MNELSKQAHLLRLSIRICVSMLLISIPILSIGQYTVASQAHTETCDDFVYFLVGGNASSYVTLSLINGTASGNGLDYGSNSTNNIQVEVNGSWVNYSDYTVIPASGLLNVRTPLVGDQIVESSETFSLKVTPVSALIADFDIYDVNFQTINLTGWTLLSGTALQTNAVYRKTNAITINGQAIDVRAVINARSNVSSFTWDNESSNTARFQPEINSNSNSGSYIDFTFTFYLSGTNTQVALENFYVTGVDVDGSSATASEFIELSGLSSYSIDNNSDLTVTENVRVGFTRFFGIPNSLSGITFENTASFVANYVNPVSSLSMRAGYSANSSSTRLFSIAFGSSIGSFSHPVMRVMMHRLPA